MFLKTMRLICLSAAVFALPFSSGFAHNGVKHKTLNEALQHQQETTPNTAGFPDVKGGDFDLVDQDGNRRTSKDPQGHFQLVFFGYASCKAICSVALPRMVAAVDLLDAKDITVTPLLITVDPERDTQDRMKEALAHYHSRMVGLTGSDEALQIAYDAFQVKKSLVYEHPEEGPIYAHGSFIYLLDPAGNFKTLLPPILSPERMAEVTRSYVQGDAS